MNIMPNRYRRAVTPDGGDRAFASVIKAAVRQRWGLRGAPARVLLAAALTDRNHIYRTAGLAEQRAAVV